MTSTFLVSGTKLCCIFDRCSAFCSQLSGFYAGYTKLKACAWKQQLLIELRGLSRLLSYLTQYGSALRAL